MVATDKILGVFEPLQVVDSWRIEAELRQGGYGAVLRATEVWTDTPVALKIAVGTGAKQRFEREREILASLNHPGINALLDHGEYKGKLRFLVLAFVDGTRLDRFADERRLTVDDRAELFLHLCAAVKHAHDRGVIHCDLNPANVLVTSDGDIKVIDFGSAISKGTEGDAGTGAEHPGTPQYMSPEQLRCEALDERTDVYSLGVILYQLFCGSTPFGQVGEDENAVLGKEPEPASAAVFRTGRVLREGDFHSLAPEGVAQSRSTTPEALAVQLKQRFDHVLVEALHLERERRFPTVDHLTKALENALRVVD